ncbi:MAG: ribbon-helix-helix protein, CopG family [Thermoplasmata archaeon]
MPRPVRTQITVELAPKAKEALEALVRSGESLSIQDFVRRAVDEKIERWKDSGHRLPDGPGVEQFIPQPKEERRRPSP